METEFFLFSFSKKGRKEKEKRGGEKGNLGEKREKKMRKKDNVFCKYRKIEEFFKRET